MNINNFVSGHTLTAKLVIPAGTNLNNYQAYFNSADFQCLNENYLTRLSILTINQLSADMGQVPVASTNAYVTLVDANSKVLFDSVPTENLTYGQNFSVTGTVVNRNPLRRTWMKVNWPKSYLKWNEAISSAQIEIVFLVSYVHASQVKKEMAF